MLRDPEVFRTEQGARKNDKGKENSQEGKKGLSYENVFAEKVPRRTCPGVEVT